MSDCSVTFYENDDKGGKHKTFYGPTYDSNLSNNDWHDSSLNMSARSNSLKTSSQAWLKVFDSDDYKDRSLVIDKNSDGDSKGYVNLQDYDRGSGDWQDAVKSFILYDYPIEHVEPIIQRFLEFYGKTKDGNSFEFYTQDGRFVIDHPTISQHNDKLNFTLNITHKKPDIHNDDSVVVTFSMSTTGKLVNKIEVTYDMAEVREAPDWMIKLADMEIKAAEESLKLVVDCCEEALTEGLGTAAVPVTNAIIGYGADTLTFIADHINAIFKAIFRLEEDGCTLYFTSVTAHAVGRLMRAYIEHGVAEGAIIPPAGVSKTATLGFDMDGLPARLPGNNSRWVYQSNGCGHVSYFEEHDNENNNYRVWQPDFTPGYMRAGMLVSVKVDSMLTTKDDHLALNVMFDGNGDLIGLQGGILYHKNGDTDFIPPNSGLITKSYNEDGSQKEIVCLRRNADGSSNKTVLSQDNLKDAYLHCFNESFNNSANDVNYDKGTRNLPTVSLNIIDAFKESVKIEA